MKILIVLPVYNEEQILAPSVAKILDFCAKNLVDDWQVVIADNLSKDKTVEIARELCASHRQVAYLAVNDQGKGIAIKTAWQTYLADYYIFMDADLATDLKSLPDLIASLKRGSNLVIGNRYHPDSIVKRSLVRKFFSFGYRFLVSWLLNLKISDLPCGFKGIDQQVREKVLPLTENKQWFFDSELVIIAKHLGYRIDQLPVVWFDKREATDKSRVKTLELSGNYIKQILRLKKRLKTIK